MNLKPTEQLSQKQITLGLDLVIKEGMVTEAMTAMTSGTFLVALALLLGATNVQIGILAALPSFSSLFQLVAIWLLQKYKNRRAIVVISNTCARIPLLVIGSLPFLFAGSTSIQVLIFVLFFYYFFGSVAGANWNSWMKDLVPEKKLGSYFSKRTRLTQSLNVVLSLVIALSLDFIKKAHPELELITYSGMFIGGCAIGLVGVWFLSRTPEPQTHLPKENILKLFKIPLKDINYRKLLVFNSLWAFSLNIATPFFTVFMMKTLELPLSYIIAFGIMGQLAGIFAVKRWGRHSDKYSNKTVIRIAGPLYIMCILCWPFANMASAFWMKVLIVSFINIASGAAVCGINLSVGNIGLKLASKNAAIVYLTAKNMVVACFASLGPLVGGFLADYFGTREFQWNIQWHGPHGDTVVRLFELHSLGFLFIIGGLLAFLALKTINFVNEDGEVDKHMAVSEIRGSFASDFRNRINRLALLSLFHPPATVQKALQSKSRNRLENKLVFMKKYRKHILSQKTA